MRRGRGMAPMVVLMALGGPVDAQAPAWTEREVTVGTAPFALPGLVTVPAGKGPFPLVVLVHGSGPNDRDETVGPNRPFRDLAHGLAERGVAVLRYDKRTRTYPMSFAGRPFTVREETIDDAIAAVELARGLPDVDPRRVVVAGHSLGGLLAPRIAERDGRLAGVILLAGASNEGIPDMVERQLAYLRTLEGADTVMIDRQRAAVAPGIARVRALTPADSAETGLILGAPAAYWLDLAGYSPFETVRRLRMPVLVLHGERDYQAGPDGFAQWRSALGGDARIEFRSYPSLNHLFIAGTGPGNPAEYGVPGTVAGVVIDDIARWVVALDP
ncbi:MAG TPA: alpha/beta fold hydrolase [Gemmatimonadales bacterium]